MWFVNDQLEKTIKIFKELRKVSEKSFKEPYSVSAWYVGFILFNNINIRIDEQSFVYLGLLDWNLNLYTKINLDNSSIATFDLDQHAHDQSHKS